MKIALLLLMAFAANAQEKPSHAKAWWIASMGFAAAGTIADAGTSWGLEEYNPSLRSHNGRFSAKGVDLKIAIMGASLAVQVWQRHNVRARRMFTIQNFAAAGVFGAAAAHNARQH